ncbi:MAG TPA: helix-turn-helix transcriptional regulator [Acidimicrobiales bacterium]|nr:helix-turn-helix transcriptional regulator [Acidimicrobiales bacterium]
MVDSADVPSPRDRDLGPVAALFGDPARTAMLAALAGGQALPAGELARRAGVHPSTASAHLRRLIDGGLVRVRAQGRHRYHELSGPQVAAVLEALAQLAPPAPVTTLRQHQSAAILNEARTCYDHLAGRCGVELRDRLLASGALVAADDRDHVLTARGRDLLAALDLDPSRLERSRRLFARSCIDWTHRRPHLAGALAAAVTERFLTLGWLTRAGDRGLRMHSEYGRYLDEWLAGSPASDGRADNAGARDRVSR